MLGKKGDYKMNKTIWALAFVVLCSGFVFAVDNATVDSSYQTGYESSGAAGSVLIEGGNVSGTNLSSSQSTENWAGFYGNVSGYLVLAEVDHVDYMYRWTYSAADGGEVCASIDTNPTWSLVEATTALGIDLIWGFGSAVDNATNTYDTTTNFDFNGVAVGPTPAIDVQSSSTFLSGAVDFGAEAAKTDFAFCANISGSGTNYNGTAANYEIMAPTNPAASTYETYYFFVELI